MNVVKCIIKKKKRRHLRRAQKNSESVALGGSVIGATVVAASFSQVLSMISVKPAAALMPMTTAAAQMLTQISRSRDVMVASFRMR